MNSGDIAFPHLGIYLENLPKGFTVFGFFIAFYGLIIGISILICISLAARIAKKYGQNPDNIWDFCIYGIIFGFIGARIYYVAFSWDYYKDNLLSVFNYRQGGIAIYGGVIGAVITIFVYCKIKKLNPFELADACFPALLLGQAFGRWGNFFNREVFGEYTDNIFAMQLPIADVRARDITAELASHIEPGQNYIQVHPTFLYESAWNLLIVVLMLIFWKYKKFHGEVTLLYFAGYGVGRFIIEGIRTDTLFIPHTTLPVSQVLAAIMVVGAVAGDIVVRVLMSKRKKIS